MLSATVVTIPFMPFVSPVLCLNSAFYSQRQFIPRLSQGGRAGKAAAMLQEHGFSNVRVYDGWNDYTAHGGEVHKEQQ